jgi:hypothetical protein
VLLNLTSLGIGANRNVDDHTLKGLVPFLPNLTSLSLATCINVTGTYVFLACGVITRSHSAGVIRQRLGEGR